MNNRIIEAVGKVSGSVSAKVADWRLVETMISRQEHYFVRSRRELARSVRERTYALTLYVDSEAEGKKFRGDATVNIQPSYKDTEIEEKIRQGIFAASTSKNPWFDLPGPAEPKVSLPGSGFDAHGEPSMMESAKTALYAPEAGAGGARINSLELFISNAEKNFINSKGHEFKAGGWKGYSEFVVETDSSQGPVELFDDIEFSDIEKKRLGEATGSRLGQVIDRATALPMPSLGSAYALTREYPGDPVREGSREGFRLVFRQCRHGYHIHQGLALHPRHECAGKGKGRRRGGSP